MGAPPNSQVASLPCNLPFRIVSKIIGQGAYASIRRAIPNNQSYPVIAVKFINKAHACRIGRLKPKNFELEINLHRSVCPHQNIVKFGSAGEDATWVWIAMELADGGDLFDKIEADEGVGEDISHFYFTQLVSAIGWCHGKGVAHRDIKPENMLLSAQGDLKLADFGLAVQYMNPSTGKRKRSGMVCGSPPYIAPEIVAVGAANSKRKSGQDRAEYDPDGADVWSCAIVLFVLLVGNTPWDVPSVEESWEYSDFVRTKGRPGDELWSQMPLEVLSLIRGMLKTEPGERFSLDDVRKHPWFTRKNPYMSSKGTAVNPVGLATQMLEALHIDFSRDMPSSQRPRQSQGDPMDVDGQSHTLQSGWARFASTQPETPVADMPFDWETPPRIAAHAGVSASQPTTIADRQHANLTHDLVNQLMEDPSMSQFTATPSVPMSLTQQARRFNDIVPSHSLARFLSMLPFSQLLPMLLAALHRLNIPVATPSAAAMVGRENTVYVNIKTVDGRQQGLQGNVVVDRTNVQTNGQGQVLEVRFIKTKGDPLEWRRLFKRVAVLCKDAVVVPH